MLRQEEGKKVIIFGVTGQDGSFLTEKLLELGYIVYGAKRRSSLGTGHRLSKEVFSNPRFSIHNADVTDFVSVYNIINNVKPDYIYNLAAQSHVGNSFNESVSSVDITLKGCVNILECIRMICPSCKFYQASSSEMFGNSYDVNNAGEKYQNEQTKMEPCSPYAISKLAAHNFVNMFRRSYGTWAASGILFNHESERRGIEFVTRKITRYIGHLHHHLRGDNRFSSIEKLCLGNVDSYRDWGYAKDYVGAMVLIMQAEQPRDYVVATGHTYTIREFLELAFLYIGQNYNDHIKIENNFKRPNDIEFLRGDAFKIRQELGWQYTHDISSIVRIMIKHDIDELKIKGPDGLQKN